MLLLFFLCGIKFGVGFDGDSALTNENATVAIYVEQSFFDDEAQYRYYMAEIPQAIRKVVQMYAKVTPITIRVITDLNINLRKDYMILLTVMDCQSTWGTYRKTQYEGLIYIAITYSPCPRLPKEEGFSIPIPKTGIEIPQILLDLRISKNLEWTKINIIYDENYDQSNMQSILQSLTTELHDQTTLITTALFAVKNDSNITAMKKQIGNIFDKLSVEELGDCFMVIVSSDTVPLILEMARKSRLIVPESQWLYIINNIELTKNSNLSDYFGATSEGENIAYIHNITRWNENCQVSIICRIKDIVKMLSISIDNFMLNNQIGLYGKMSDEGFDIPSHSNDEIKHHILHKINQDLYKKPVLESQCGGCLVWKITSTIAWGNLFTEINETDMYLDVGYWSLDVGINMLDALFPHAVYGFRGRALPIATYHNPPWQIIETSSDGEKSFSGIVFDILYQLSEQMNFTLNVVAATTQEKKDFMASQHEIDFKNLVEFDEAAMSTAQVVPEELIKLVIDKKIFIGACASSTLRNARSGLNFTLPISIQSYSLLAPNPAILSRAMLFIAPFTPETWATLFGSILLVSPVLFYIQKISFILFRGDENEIGFHTHWQCVWYIYGALLQQGGANLPHSSGARLLVGTWWLVVMVLVAMYSGALVAFLTFPRMDDAVTVIDELLARKDEYSWGFPNGSIIEEFLESMESEKYKEFLNRAERHNTTDVIEVVKRIKGTKHVLLDWTTSLRFLMRTDFLSTGLCYFTLSGIDLANEPISLLVAEDNPYIHIINKQLQRMHESGLIKKWTTNRMPVKDQCWEGKIMNPEASKHKVDMSDMQGIFFVLALGFTFAVIFICCEFFCHRRKIIRELKLVRPFIN